MCIRCNINIPKRIEKDAITIMLEELLNKDTFEHINTSDVNKILYSCIGIHSIKTKRLAIKTMHKIIEWLNIQDLMYLPQNSEIPMYNPRVLLNLVNWCESYTNSDNNLDKEQLLELLCTKFDEFDKNELDNNLYYLFMKKSKKICISDILMKTTILGLSILSYKKIKKLIKD